MKFQSIVNAGSIVIELMNLNVKKGDTVLDCTVGNGNDTLILAKLVGDQGKVYGFDIQSQAIDNTSYLLKQNNLKGKVILINDSHEYIDKYIDEKLSFIIYNLGYLPKGDKTIKTNKISSAISLNKALNLLDDHGLMVITAYVGHDGGTDEKDEIEKLLKHLNQKEYNVLKYDFLNQINNPPILYAVEKVIIK